MPDLVPVFVLLALAVAGLALMDRATGGTFRAFSASFAAYRDDRWPVGVQEEDRQQPWGRNMPGRRGDDESAAVEAVRVRGAVRARKLRE